MREVTIGITYGFEACTKDARPVPGYLRSITSYTRLVESDLYDSVVVTSAFGESRNPCHVRRRLIAIINQNMTSRTDHVTCPLSPRESIQVPSQQTMIRLNFLSLAGVLAVEGAICKLCRTKSSETSWGSQEQKALLGDRVETLLFYLFA